MCQFISWNKYKDKVYFLTNTDLDIKNGRIFKEYKKFNPNWREDIYGHGALEYFYPELKGKGVKKECVDFSSPDNFPKEIVEALKKGWLSRIGIVTGILNAEGLEQYKKVEALAWEQYEKIEAPAWEQYKKIKAPAWEQYEKVEAPALEQYEKIKASAWEQYKKVEAPAFASIVRLKKYRRENWK